MEEPLLTVSYTYTYLDQKNVIKQALVKTATQKPFKIRVFLFRVLIIFFAVGLVAAILTFEPPKNSPMIVFIVAGAVGGALGALLVFALCKHRFALGTALTCTISRKKISPLYACFTGKQLKGMRIPARIAFYESHLDYITPSVEDARSAPSADLKDLPLQQVREISYDKIRKIQAAQETEELFILASNIFIPKNQLKEKEMLFLKKLIQAFI